MSDFASPLEVREFLREQFDLVADYMGVRHWNRYLSFGSHSEFANGVGNNLRTVMTVQSSEPYQTIQIIADCDYMYLEQFTKKQVIETLEHEYIHALLSPFATYQEDVQTRYVPGGDEMAASNKLFLDREERTVAQIHYMIGCLKRHLAPPEVATSSEIPNNS